MQQSIHRLGRLFREWLLNICGYRIGPPTHDDPRIKGPPPRILTRRQWEAIETMRREWECGKSELFKEEH